MKQIYAFLAVFALCTFAAPAHAVPVSASTATQLFSSVNLTTAYSQLFSASQVVKAVKGMTISNSASAPIFIAIGGSGSEVSQLMVPAGSAAPGSSAPTYYPMVISQNQRISIKASTGTISTGAIQVNLLYN